VTHPLLISSDAKLRWAKRHIQTLQDKIFGIRGDLAYGAAMRADPDVESGYHIRTIKEMPDYGEFTERVALGVGDVIGSARAALDHAIWHLVSDHVGPNPQRPRSIGFPLCDTAELLQEDRSARAVKPQVASPVWEIVVRAQPYNPYPGAGGVDQPWGRWVDAFPHPFTLLRDLSNDDKHRLVTLVLLLPGQWMTPNEYPTVQRDDYSKWSAEQTLANIARIEATIGKPMTSGKEVVRERLVGAEAHIEDAGHITPDVAFPGVSWPHPVVATLERILSLIEFFLDEFERALPAVAS
jgi:hypothetical protein